jgi:hypothetical protein
MLTDEEFAHWLSGFCDAESLIYNFKFKLNIDDIKVLQYFSQRLGIGKYIQPKLMQL